jgi:ferrous iron transport protein B
MMDLVSRKGISIDVDALSKKLNIPVVAINPRKNEGIKELKRVMEKTAKQAIEHSQFIEVGELAIEPVKEIRAIFPGITDYTAVHTLINHESMDFDDQMQDRIETIEQKSHFNHTKVQGRDRKVCVRSI